VSLCIEKNGTGVEKNGTGLAAIEKNGTGAWRGAARAALFAAVAFGMSASALADVRGFVELGDRSVRLALADRTSLLTGTAVPRSGYARIDLRGVSCGGTSGLFVEGSGTGSPNVEGSGTGRTKVEGSGTGRTNVEGSGTGRTNVEGSGTGRTNVEGSGTGRTNVEGSGTGAPAQAICGSLMVEGSGTGRTNVEGSGTGRTNVEGSGTGRTKVEGSGTGRTNVEGSGTGRTQVEGSGTGAPQSDRRVARYAEIALNGRTASVIVYGVAASGQPYEMAMLELPVLRVASPLGAGQHDRINQ
jgi:hypothetical protein